MIIIKKNINYRVLDCVYKCPGLLETIAVTITLNTSSSKKLTLVSYYRPPKQKLSKNVWKKLIKSLPLGNLNIMGGDANSHNSL